MLIAKQSHQIEPAITPADALAIIRKIESAARTCYKSEPASEGNQDASRAFVRKLVQVLKHESVMEHASITVRFICDRGVSHELVRHRLAAYSQESTRYCNYAGYKFGGHITLIHPAGLTPNQRFRRECLYLEIQNIYNIEVGEGVSPQIARGILPNALKTEIVMTANIREWRHVFRMRAKPPAHPQMVELMAPLLKELQETLPELFDDIK